MSSYKKVFANTKLGNRVHVHTYSPIESGHHSDPTEQNWREIRNFACLRGQDARIRAIQYFLMEDREVWLKTATVHGHARVWIRIARGD